MDKTSRIILFFILVPALGVMFYLWESSISSASDISIILFSSLLMLAFVTLFIEHFFTRPSDVLASTISILLLLSPMKTELGEWGDWYYIFYAYNFLLLTTAFLALLIVDKNKSPDCKQNKVAYYLKQFSSHCGNGRWLYFCLFILTLLFYVDSQSTPFLWLFGFSAFILFARPREFIEKILTRESKHTTDIGEIFGVHSKNTFLAKLYDYEGRASVTRFNFVEFRYQMDRKTYRGLIIDTYFLNQAQWVKILTSPEINAALEELPNSPEQADNIISKITATETPELLERLVGLTVERTDILKLRFEYVGKAKVSEGTLLEVKVDGKAILYQVVQGTTDTELLESKDERGFIVGEAIQLGTWNKELCTFEKFGWVPEINSPVYLAAPIEAVTPHSGEYIVGYIPPDAHFPAIINKEEAVTHHLAILGVTGTGKSVFARNLIREIMDDGTKVICVDFTYEYKKRFDGCEPVVSSEASKTMFKTIDDLTLELAKWKDKQDATKITNWQRSLHSGFAKSIKEFLESDRKIAVFELPDVSNTMATLEYTRWFFNVLFKVAKHKNNYGNRVCVVLEEAHTIVPEHNSMGVADNGSKQLVNSIAQIALQGRKYDIGFMVIAQRTANVSKTILTQCNSIIAFQQFDRTSSDFLSAYMGRDLAEALPRLKPRHAVAVGKAFKANIPMIFKVPDIDEPEVPQEEATPSPKEDMEAPEETELQPEPQIRST